MTEVAEWAVFSGGKTNEEQSTLPSSRRATIDATISKTVVK